MSEDGSVVVGNSFGQDTITPFRWSVAAGLELLQPLPGDAGAWTLGVSPDGSLVTGFSSEYPLTSDDLGVRPYSGEPARQRRQSLTNWRQRVSI